MKNGQILLKRLVVFRTKNSVFLAFLAGNVIYYAFFIVLYQDLPTEAYATIQTNRSFVIPAMQCIFCEFLSGSYVQKTTIREHFSHSEYAFGDHNFSCAPRVPTFLKTDIDFFEKV